MTEVLATADHLSWRTIITAEADTPADIVSALNDYFQRFAQPVFDESRETEKPMLCLKCGEPLTGLLASMFGRGGFEWGLAHGEGHCRCCGWPGRAMHYIKDSNGEEFLSVRNLVLQYHPDYVEARKSARAQAAGGAS